MAADKTGQVMRDIRRLARDIEARQEQVEQMRVVRDGLMREARRNGVPFREIADASGITVQRIEQIVYDRED